MIDGGKALAGELSIGGSFIPTNAGHREIVLALGIVALNPILRPGSSRRIPEQRHRLVPAQLLFVMLKLLLPVFSLLISALIDKSLELPVGDFILVDPIILERKLGHRFVTWDIQRL